MIKRDDIYRDELAYVHHVRAEAARLALRSLRFFEQHLPPEQVVAAMKQSLSEGMREHRKDAIRAVIRSRKEAQP